MAIAVFTSFEQLCDNAGDPLDGGSVTVYEDATTTPIQLYSVPGLTAGFEVGNPITLDAYGRHAMTYFAVQAYKVVVKDFGGSTIFTRDLIDPGVPVGSGALPITNGGTGATDAATALSNLGGATTAELADLAADVAAVTGALASTEKTHIATGTTGERPASPAEGDVRRNTTVPQWEGYNGAAWDVFVTEATAGAQASAAKAWCKVQTDGTIQVQDNVTSVVKNSTGDWTVTLTNAFADSDYVIITTVETTSAFMVMSVNGQSPTGFTLKGTLATSGADQDPSTGFYFVCYGTLA